MPAMANDASSELAAGGLVLTKTDAISMQREDLFLSPDEVRVRYEYRNDTGAPVSLRVAFPLPPVPVDGPGGPTLFSPDGTMLAHNIDLQIQEANFLNLRLTVDGKDQPVQTEIRADLPDGRNIVQQLYQLGGWRLVLTPSFYTLDPSPDGAEIDDSGPTLDRGLRALGAVHGENGSGMPLWSTHVTLHWQQTFRPGITVVEHRYRPVLGTQLVQSVRPDLTPDIESDRLAGSWDEALADAFCIDPPTRQAIRDLERTALQASPPRGLIGLTLGYILQTARNWRGPIGTFHLTIAGDQTFRKGFGPLKSGAVTLCSDLPLHQTGPQRFEATAQDYVPQHDLRVLFVAQ